MSRLASQSALDPREAAPSADDGAGRVRLRFEPGGADVRVPSGTPVFDAASWNGIAIDSTCGGHGTCKKCKVRIVSGEVPVGARPGRPGRRGAASANPAEGCAGRGSGAT